MVFEQAERHGCRVVQRIRIVHVQKFEILFLTSERFFGNFFDSDVFDQASCKVDHIDFRTRQLISRIIFIVSQTHGQINVGDALFSGHVFIDAARCRGTF